MIADSILSFFNHSFFIKVTSVQNHAYSRVQCHDCTVPICAQACTENSTLVLVGHLPM